MIKLYDCTTAPSPRRARIFLAEKGVEYECIQIDLTKAEQMGEAFRAINPNCTVPVLVTATGESLCENLGIASYIEDMYPNPPLIGTDPISRAQVLSWNWRCEFEGLAAFAEVLRNLSPAMKGRALTGPQNIEQIPELVARGRARLDAFFVMINERLESHEFIAGDTFSLADITAAVTVDVSKWIKNRPDESLTALWSWHKKVAARPSMQA